LPVVDRGVFAIAGSIGTAWARPSRRGSSRGRQALFHFVTASFGRGESVVRESDQVISKEEEEEESVK
jgi:hypothetical protein